MRDLKAKRKEAIEALLETSAYVESCCKPVPKEIFSKKIEKAKSIVDVYMTALEKHLERQALDKGLTTEEEIWAIAWPEMEPVIKLLDALLMHRGTIQ